MSSLADLLRYITGSRVSAGLRERLIGATLAQTLIRVGGQALALALGVTLARVLGPRQLGTYAYTLAWINLVNLPAAAGLHTLVMREVPVFLARRDWPRMRGLLGWANRTALISALVLCVVVVALALLFPLRSDPYFLTTLLIGVALVPITTLKRLRGATLRGLHRPSLGGIAETVLVPVLLIGTLAAGTALEPGLITAPWAMTANLATTAAAFLIGTWILFRVLPSEVKAAVPAYEHQAWLGAAFPLLAYQVLAALQGRADTLLLGMLTGTRAVGIYSVAITGAELVSFVYLAATAVVAPLISKLYAAGELDRLQRMMTASARVVFIASLPVAALLLLQGRRVLELLFGPGYAEGYSALAIYSLARLVNVAAGWNGMGLIMTGRQVHALVAVGGGLAAEVALALVLIPRWGLTGAALAGGAGMVVWNIIMTWTLRRRLGLDSTILGRGAIPPART